MNVKFFILLFITILFLHYNFVPAQTWQFDDSPTHQNLARLDMLSNRLGWAVSYDGLLLKFENNNWKIVDTLNSISKYNFTKQDSSLNLFSNVGDIYSIRIPNNTSGWIALNNTSQHFYIVAQFNLETLQFNAKIFPIKIRALDFWDDGKGFIVGEGGGYYYKNNTWFPLKLPLSVDFRNVKIVNKEKVFICGEKGTLLVGNEGGWTNVETNLTEQLRDMDFISENEGWIVGYNGIILHYKDGEIDQEIVEIVNNLWAVDMISANLGYAVGEKGVILQYNGDYWDLLELNSDVDLHDIEIFSPNSGFIVGSRGAILKLSDEVIPSRKQHRFLFSDQVHLGSKYLIDRINDVYGISIADFNGDYQPDIYMTCYKSLNHLLINEGKGYYKDIVIESGTGGNIETRVGKEKYEYGSIAADFDRDGDIDLLLAGKRNTTRYYINDGNANFSDYTSYTNLPRGLNIIDGALGDLNEDGYPDFVLADDNRGILIFINDKYNQFYRLNIDSLNLPVTGVRAIKIADVNNDNNQDILAIYLNKPPFFLVNDGNCNLHLNQEGMIDGEIPVCTNSISIADFNNDGLNDFYLCSQDGNDALFIYDDEDDIFRNNSITWNVQFGGRSYTAVAGDFNLDGFIDLFVSRYGPDLLYLNTGNSNFREIGRNEIYSKYGFLSGFNTGSASCDIDGNGSVDLLVGNSDYWSSVLQNGQEKSSFIKLFLLGIQDTKEALGAKIWIWPSGEEQNNNNLIAFKEILPSNGLFSQNSSVSIFGLGDVKSVDIKIRFLNGKTKFLRNVSSGSTLHIEQSSFFIKQIFNFSRSFLQILHMPTMIWEIIKFVLFALMIYVSVRFIERRYNWRPTNTVVYALIIITLYLIIIVFFSHEDISYHIFPFGMIIFALLVLIAVNEPTRKINLIQRLNQKQVQEAAVELSRIQVFTEASKVVQDTLKIITPYEYLAIYNYHTNGNVFTIGEYENLLKIDLPATFIIKREEVHHLLTAESPINMEGSLFYKDDPQEVFNGANIFPLVRKNELLGVVIIKFKDSEETLRLQNQEIVKYLFLQLSIALDDLRILKELGDHEKLSAIGTFSSRIIHDLKNPIEGLRMIIEILRDEIDKTDTRRKYVEELYSGILSLKNKLLHSFDFVNYGKITNVTVSINELLCDIVKNYKSSTYPLFEMNLYREDLKISGDLEQLKFAFENLIQNAIEASDLKVPIIIITQLDGKGFCTIDVIDQGEGISDENMGRIFDMFFSTKEKSRGLGLTLVQKIIKNHNGYINVSRGNNKGTKFSVVLPII